MSEAAEMAVEETTTTAPTSVLDAPPVVTGKRERKSTVRLEVAAPDKKEEEFVVPKGAGTALGELENVNFHINKYTAGGEELKKMYILCYGKVGKKTVVKAHLRQYCGKDWSDEAVKEKEKAKLLERLQVTNNGLKQLLEICDQDTAGKREELIARLAAFIETPTASGLGSIADKQAADKKKKAEKKANDVAKKARKKELLAKKKAKAERKKDLNKKKRERGAKKKATSEKKKSAAAAKKKKAEEDDDSESEVEVSESESESEEEAPPKKKAKKKTALKPAAVASDSDDDEPIGAMKKPKIVVTEALLQEKIEAMAKADDFETLTMRGIREKLAADIGVTGEALGEHKGKIKEIVTAIVSEEGGEDA